MFKKKYNKRLLSAMFLITLSGIAVGMILYSLNQNLNLFLTPTQLKTTSIPTNHTLRLGGLVKKGSLQRKSDGLTVTFTLTDQLNELLVRYTGVLPDLFKEGKGAIAEGHFANQTRHEFIATKILAKHDENYKPMVRTSS